MIADLGLAVKHDSNTNTIDIPINHRVGTKRLDNLFLTQGHYVSRHNKLNYYLLSIVLLLVA